MCEICEDVELVRWHQLALDDSHVVEYEAHECLCGIRLARVTVREVVGDASEGSG